jgi:predicted nucleic acid-binding protein
MILLDSNIIIYAADPRYVFLREFIRVHVPVVSIVNYIEVLGYDKLSEEQKVYFEEFFDCTHILPIDYVIAKKAIALRQRRRMSLGDAVIAATAIVYAHTLVTRNINDFKWITGITLLDPFELNAEGHS